MSRRLNDREDSGGYAGPSTLGIAFGHDSRGDAPAVSGLPLWGARGLYSSGGVSDVRGPEGCWEGAGKEDGRGEAGEDPTRGGRGGLVGGLFSNKAYWQWLPGWRGGRSGAMVGIMDGKDEFGLLPKQRMFADLYLGGMYATEALKAAGYREMKAAKGAYRMLQRKEIREYVKLQREKLAEKMGIQREDLVMYLWRVIWTPILHAEEQSELLEFYREWTMRDGRTRKRVRMVNKMAAIKQLVTLMGWGELEKPEAVSELGEIIRAERERGREKWRGSSQQ